MERLSEKNCLILCRVSTLKQARQGESIEVQEKICLALAEAQNLGVFKIFREHFSGRKDKRPVIEDIFDCIKQNPGKISVLIIRGIDRMTRAGSTPYDQFKQRLFKYGITLLDSYGTIQPQINTLAHLGVEYDWSSHSPSEMTELILAQQSKKEVTDILTRTIGAEIELARTGYKVRSPNDGYINKIIFVEGKRKVIQVADPERSNLYVQMFELRASGAYTDIQIVNRINAMGFRTRPRNRWSKDKSRVIGQYGNIALTIKQLQVIIQNPIYCGVNTEKWLTEPIKTKYEGLVSIDTFNKANRTKVFIETLQENVVKIHRNHSPLHVKRLKNNPQFPYRFILCPVCNKPLTGSSSTGKSGQKFPAYHCSRKHVSFRVKQRDFDNTISYFTTNLEYKDGFLISLERALMKMYRGKENILEDFAARAAKNAAELEIHKKQRIDAFLSTQNATIRKELEKQIEELQNQIEQVTCEGKGLDIAEKDIHAFIAYAKNLMEHPENLLYTKDINRLRTFYGLVFDEVPTYTEIANGTPKLSLPYQLSKEFSQGKSELGCLNDLDWNEVQITIKKWNDVFNGLSPP